MAVDRLPYIYTTVTKRCIGGRLRGHEVVLISITRYSMDSTTTSKNCDTMTILYILFAVTPVGAVQAPMLYHLNIHVHSYSSYPPSYLPISLCVLHHSSLASPFSFLLTSASASLHQSHAKSHGGTSSSAK